MPTWICTVFLQAQHDTGKPNKDKVFAQSLLACIGWYKPHLEKNYLHSPVTLWYPDLEPISAASFMPINRIACRRTQSQTYMEFTERPYNNGQAVIIPIDFVDFIWSWVVVAFQNFIIVQLVLCTKCLGVGAYDIAYTCEIIHSKFHSWLRTHYWLYW